METVVLPSVQENRPFVGGTVLMHGSRVTSCSKCVKFVTLCVVVAVEILALH